MSSEKEINLRDIFQDKLRSKLYNILASGSLAGYDYKYIYQVVDLVLKEAKYEIDNYLRTQIVNLLNMNLHADAVVEKILTPHLEKKRVQ